jgi:Skp family chaperone for outer membrane proteins
MKFFAEWYDSGGMILVWVILAAGLICLIAFLIRQKIKSHSKDGKEIEEAPKDEKQIAQEELNRILKPIDDEQTKKQMDEYKEDDK